MRDQFERNAGHLDGLATTDQNPMIGVVVVTYQSADVITECLESLIQQSHENIRIVVSDNNSSDNTLELVRSLFTRHRLPLRQVELGDEQDTREPVVSYATLVMSSKNRGFAAAVNAGLQILQMDQDVELFWILNPDATADPDAARCFVAHHARVGAGLMGGRLLYHNDRSSQQSIIQSDGGVVNWITGVTRNLNARKSVLECNPLETTPPDYISGASMVVTRKFLELGGLMREDYFLFYEEVDWAWRGRKLGLSLCPEAIVYHRTGTSTGSANETRRASSLFTYFNFRNRVRFMGRHRPFSLPFVFGFALLQLLRLFVMGDRSEAVSGVRGLFQLSPPQLLVKTLGLSAGGFDKTTNGDGRTQ